MRIFLLKLLSAGAPFQPRHAAKSDDTGGESDRSQLPEMRLNCDLADRDYRQWKRPALLRGGGRFGGREHNDFGADRGAVVEIDDVLVRQAETA